VNQNEKQLVCTPQERMLLDQITRGHLAIITPLSAEIFSVSEHVELETELFWMKAFDNVIRIAELNGCHVSCCTIPVTIGGLSLEWERPDGTFPPVCPCIMRAYDTREGAERFIGSLQAVFSRKTVIRS